MIIFIKTLLALLPIAWYIMEGVKSRHLTALIIAFLAVELGFNRPGLLLRHKWVGLWAGGYFVAEFFTRSTGTVFDYKDLLLMIVYAFLGGICLASWAKQQQEMVLAGLAVFGGLMALMGVVMLRTVGVENLVMIQASGIERANADSRTTFMRLFGISNVIIGIVPYTIFALSWLPVLLLKLDSKIRLVASVGLVVAFYSNLQTLTRTNFASIGFATIFIYVVMLKSTPEVRRRMVGYGVGGLLLLLIGGSSLIARSRGLSALSERFSESASDNRLDVWAESLSLLAKHPGGHGIENLTTHLWAHNLFLDVGLTSGWAGLMMVVSLAATIILAWWRLLKLPGASRNPLMLLMLSSTLAIFVASMLHPPLPYYIAWLILSGVFAAEWATLVVPSVRRPSNDLRGEPEGIAPTTRPNFSKVPWSNSGSPGKV